MKNTYTCIVCPMSCQITVEEEGEDLAVSGYTCKRGRRYAVNEHRSPKRMVTSTVRVENGILRRLPVVSNAEIPKSKMTECLKAVYAAAVSAPVKCGDIVISNICDTGVDIIASRDIDLFPESKKQ